MRKERERGERKRSINRDGGGKSSRGRTARASSTRREEEGRPKGKAVGGFLADNDESKKARVIIGRKGEGGSTQVCGRTLHRYRKETILHPLNGRIKGKKGGFNASSRELGKVKKPLVQFGLKGKYKNRSKKRKKVEIVQIDQKEIGMPLVLSQRLKKKTGLYYSI